MEDKQNITLKLVSHTVALCVPREQEPIYREAAERINASYKKYSGLYPKLPIENIWVYVALEMAVNFQSDVRDKNIQPILDKIKELNELITSHL